ncbi:sulfotransferase [Mangrovimonas sp. DI 80]|uniref:sulfotransferase n=1 Tax=Mangrovimonas sp. DI 80 TaxID=1779330 RepID=UPI000977FBB1|nr:sulfotransferase [Mangrovimonas sp. DI 80]OMP31797.1 hypothetical protein BKM32_01680 [Mangrovimonas sp. DI 80]
MAIYTNIFRSFLFKSRFVLREVLDYHNNEIEDNKKTIMMNRIREKGSSIFLNGKVKITHPEMVSLGDNIHIGDNAYIHSDGGLIIGDNTHISRNLVIYTSSHEYNGDAIPYNNERIYKSVCIERNVWIGMNVCICPGVTIGEGAIIGLGCVVSKDVPPYSIVGNAPQRILKDRDIDSYNKNKERQRFGGVNGKPVSLESSYDVMHLEHQPFFIVGTGRSGSETISKILSQHPNVTCRHEPKGRLIKLSTEYAQGSISKERVKQELVNLYSQVSVVTTDFYGESDQKYSNLISILFEIFPKSKFIWLIREAKPTITSMYSRGWFCDREYGYRIRKDKCIPALNTGRNYTIGRLDGSKIEGVNLTENEWKEMTPFERNCWYWSYWNSVIETQFQSLPNESKLFIRLEDINDKINVILEFLSLPNFEFQVLRSNQAQYQLLGNWTIEDEEAYKKWCQEKMTIWYDNNFTIYNCELQ